MRWAPSRHALGQYCNTQGLRTFLSSLLYHRAYFTPHLRVPSVAALDYAALKARGIEHIVFDKDNTVTVPYERRYASMKIHDSLIHYCVGVFGHSNVAFLSNSAGSSDDKDHHEAVDCEHVLGIQFIRHKQKKPAVREDILRHFGTSRPDTICVVGDRVLSDIVMGNQFGMFTVLVDPIDPSKDNFVVRLVRRFESRLVGRQSAEHPVVGPAEGLIKRD